MSGPFLSWSPRESGLLTLSSTTATFAASSVALSHPVAFHATGDSYAMRSIQLGRLCAFRATDCPCRHAPMSFDFTCNGPRSANGVANATWSCK